MKFPDRTESKKKWKLTVAMGAAAAVAQSVKHPELSCLKRGATELTQVPILGRSIGGRKKS